MSRQTIIGSIGAISVSLAAMSYIFPWFGAATMMFFGMVLAEEIGKTWPPVG